MKLNKYGPKYEKTFKIGGKKVFVLHFILCILF